MTTTVETVPFTVDEVQAATGIYSLERIWERIETADLFPYAQVKSVWLPTEAHWAEVPYWSHACAKVVRAIAAWSAMTPEVRQMVDPLLLPSQPVSLTFVARQASLHQSVAHQALVDLVRAGLLPGEIGHDFGRDLVTVSPALLT